jgi:hypothetical protein
MGAHPSLQPGGVSARQVLFGSGRCQTSTRPPWRTVPSSSPRPVSSVPRSCTKPELALLGRCWTSERLQHHSLPNSGVCALCSQSDEVLSHLLLMCVYSREVWAHCLQAYELQCLQPGVEEELGVWWLRCRKQINKSVCKGFDTMVILVWWRI